jgi:hypothetical protein
MRTRKHPLSGALYDVDAEGLVHVVEDGKLGVFTPEGVWVRGDLTHCDPNLCGWLAGPQVIGPYAVLPKDLPSGPVKR